MRYVIMANGKGRRWHNHLGIPKHLIVVDGETLLQRTTRLAHACDPAAEVVITSANPDCIALGATRHEPQRNALEIDRFCYELIADETCFLYGDAFYTADAMRRIVDTSTPGVGFFGTARTVLCMKATDAELLRGAINELVWMIAAGTLEDAKGWQLYHLLQGMPLAGKEIGAGFCVLDGPSTDFNRPEEWEAFAAEHGRTHNAIGRSVSPPLPVP